jgi:hypothetical protein
LLRTRFEVALPQKHWGASECPHYTSLCTWCFTSVSTNSTYTCLEGGKLAQIPCPSVQRQILGNPQSRVYMPCHTCLWYQCVHEGMSGGENVRCAQSIHGDRCSNHQRCETTDRCPSRLPVQSPFLTCCTAMLHDAISEFLDISVSHQSTQAGQDDH